MSVTVFSSVSFIIDYMSYCEYCGKQLPPYSGRGRHRHFCDMKCLMRAKRDVEKRPPQLMMMEDRWVRWKRITRNNRVTKMPIQIDGTPASVTDPLTWNGYAMVDDSTVGDGMGYVLGNGVACIDLDHCYDERNHLTGWAKMLLAIAPSTFIELSPSGDGLHIWGLCEPRLGIKIRDGMNVEAYSRDRYITVTGKPYNKSVNKLADITPLFDMIERLQ